MSQDQDLIQFQSTHTDHEGKPLAVDGVMGPRTLWAMAVDSLRYERKVVLARAIESIGIREVPMGSNRGPDIDYWLQRCGVTIPPKGVAAPQNAWCAAYISWVLSQANWREFKYARVYDFVHKSGLKQITVEQTQPSDLGCFLQPDGTGHIWLLTGKEMTEKGWVTMNIEGNTSNAVRCTLREHTPRTMYLQTFGAAASAGIIKSVPFASSSTT